MRARSGRQGRVVVLVALGLAAACASPEEKAHERADVLERTYHLATADARRLEQQHPELSTAEALSLYERVAGALGMKRLVLEDVPAFVSLVKTSDAERDRLADQLVSPGVVDTVDKLRKSTGYEPAFSEATAIIASAANPASVAPALETATSEAAAIVRARAPLARVSLASIPALVALGHAPRARLVAALDRLSELSVDLGVRELDPGVLSLVANVAQDPARLFALSVVVRELPSLHPQRVDPAALARIATIGSSALVETLEPLGETRSFRTVSALLPPTAEVIAILAERPRAAALVPILEDASPDFALQTARDARELVSIDAASPSNQAREHLGALLRGRVVVDAVDERGAALLRDLVKTQGMRDALRSIHDTWPSWRATPRDREALALLVDAKELPLLGRALRSLGLDVGERGLDVATARELAALSALRATELADALKVVFPRVSVRTSAALHELAELAKAGVTAEKLLRLDANWLSGPLDAGKRQQIVQKVAASG